MRPFFRTPRGSSILTLFILSTRCIQEMEAGRLPEWYEAARLELVFVLTTRLQGKSAGAGDREGLLETRAVR